jgi:hypothetical protein
VRYHHELGDSRSAENGIVGSLKIRDFELDVLGVVVLPSLPSSSFSCTSTSLTTEFEADKYKISGDFGLRWHSLVISYK